MIEIVYVPNGPKRAPYDRITQSSPEVLSAVLAIPNANFSALLSWIIQGI